MRIVPREVETLWTLFTAPLVWAVHFLVCYIGAAVYCAKRDHLPVDFGAVRIGIGVVTFVALALILASAWLAWRQWGFGMHDPPHDEPSRYDRRHFQGFATLLLSGLSFIAVIYVALAAVFVSECAR